MSYITVTASLGDLPYEVNKYVQEGYVPLGGPAPGPEAYLGRKWVQAMFKASSDTQAEVGTCGEVGDRSPPLAVDLAHRFPSEDERRRYEKGVMQINLVLLEPERLHRMTPHERKDLVDVSGYHLTLKLRQLRHKQQEPYTKYTTPETEKEVLAKLQEDRRIGYGVMGEYFAACHARNPEAKPQIMLSLADARVIAKRLEPNSSVQYPTEIQAAVNRLQATVQENSGHES